MKGLKKIMFVLCYAVALLILLLIKCCVVNMDMGDYFLVFVFFSFAYIILVASMVLIVFLPVRRIKKPTMVAWVTALVLTIGSLIPYFLLFTYVQYFGRLCLVDIFFFLFVCLFRSLAKAWLD